MTAAWAARLEALRRELPSYEPWLATIAVALEAAGEHVWQAAAAGAQAAPAPDRPALAGAQFVVEERSAGRLLQRLLEVAAQAPGDAARALLGAARSHALDPCGVLEGALAGDRARLARHAEALGASPQAFVPVAELAALPLLLACGRRFAGEREAWTAGSCPTCDAWPAVAELRGLDRSVRLRCARCAADWGGRPLACPYCGNVQHERLRALVPEGAGESRKIEACDDCHGYVKALAQLRPIPADQVLLEDLATGELDLAAIEHGYRRPEPRAALPVRVAPAR